LKIRAAVLERTAGPMEVTELELAAPGPGEVLVRLHASGVCHSDQNAIDGTSETRCPAVLGHEGAGVVEYVGDEVDSVFVGDEVVLSWAPSCGHCADCARGRPAACVPLHRAIGNGTLVDGSTGMSFEGETVYRGTATGAWAEHVVVSSQVALPTGGAVPLRDAALLGCAALTGVGAVLFAARAEPGGVVLVIGAGGVGQFVVQGARIAGAEAIVVVDPVESRRDQALRLGATHGVHPDDLKEAMKGIAPEGADYGFDAVGFPETSATALRFSRSGGTTVMVGLPPTGLRLDLDPGEFLRREKFLTGTMYGSEDPAVALPILLEHVAAGRLELAPLLGEIFPLDAIDAAVQASLELPAGRVLVEP
jgi:Zn-dependent alcohol dehydrogenase